MAQEVLGRRNLDPRVLISYYPDLRGQLFRDDEHVGHVCRRRRVHAARDVD